MRVVAGIVVLSFALGRDADARAEWWTVPAGDSTSAARLLGAGRTLQLHADDGTARPLVGVPRIERTDRGTLFPLNGPLRRFVLANGDTLSGELLALDQKRIVIRTRWGGRTELPRGRISAVESLEELLDALPGGAKSPRDGWTLSKTDRPPAWQTDGDRGLVAAVTAPWELTAGIAAETSIARFSFLWHDPNRANDDSRLAIDLTFIDDARREFRLSIPLLFSDAGAKPSRQSHTMPAGFDVTPRARRAGWQRTTVLFPAGQLRVLRDVELTVSGPAPSGRLERIGIRIERDSTAPAASSQWRIGLPQLQRWDRAGTRETFARLDPARDVVVLAGGDELCGEAVSTAESSLKMSVAGRELPLPWSDVRSLQLAEKPASVESVSAKSPGVRARIVLAAPADFSPLPRDVLHGTIQSATESELVVAHPALGALTIPVTHVVRIEPRGFGSLHLLDGGVHHLGDEVRTDFRRPRPAGTALEGSFTFDALPAGGEGQLCFDVVDVEPCGPEAPKGTPFLPELRAGFLRTEVTLNGRSLGDLNSRLTYRNSPEGRQKVRIPFDMRWLKEGANVWRLRQKPSRLDPSSFDDCEIGPVMLELDFPANEK